MKLKFLTPVDYDGKRYQPGESAEVKRTDVDGLIDIGAAELVDPKAAAKAEAAAQAEAKAAAEAQAKADAEAQAKADGEAAAAELLKANGGQPPASE